jgi:hypothetical protein
LARAFIQLPVPSVMIMGVKFTNESNPNAVTNLGVMHFLGKGGVRADVARTHTPIL